MEEKDRGLTASVVLPVVTLDELKVDFTSYPANSAAVAVTRVGLVQGTTDKYHQASARAIAQLSDGTSYTVTNATTFSSIHMAIVQMDGSHLLPQSAGIATIEGVFASSTAARANLEVLSSVVDAAASACA